MEKDIKKLQSVILIISKEIKRICDKNNIDYSMIGGTLIGAVRHKGFIPWDDDMDFVMTRDNYEKFLIVCNKELSSDFFILNWKNNKCFGSGFTKVMLRDTLAVETGKENVKYPTNIFVDIFPIDNIPNIRRKQIMQKIITYTCIRMLQQKECKYFLRMKGIKKFIYSIVYFFSIFFSHDFLVKICENEMNKYYCKNTEQVTSIAGFYGYEKEKMSKSLFERYVELTFEDTCFKAFVGYDIYLRAVFGDYMVLPPIEKRRAHGLVNIDFGKY